MKNALECRERLLPSITWMLRARKRVRSASSSSRSRRLPSGSGVNLLNSGRISTGASTGISS